MADNASGVLGGQHAGGHSDVFENFKKSSAQTLSTPMGGAHGQIDYSVDLSQAKKVTPEWTAQQNARRSSRLAAQAASAAARKSGK